MNALLVLLLLLIGAAVGKFFGWPGILILGSLAAVALVHEVKKRRKAKATAPHS